MAASANTASDDSLKRDGKRILVLNEKGKLIKKAFMWKLKGMTNEEISERLNEAGFKTQHQQVSRLLRNPFYYGLLVHSALEGEIIEGIQEKAVSKEIFLEVNGVLAKNHQGYSTYPHNEEVPLKRFVQCDKCGSYLRENDECRTSSVNNIFLILARLSGSWDEKKVRGATSKSGSAHWVDSAEKLSNSLMSLFSRIYPLKKQGKEL